MKKILLVYPKPKLNKSPRFGFSIQLLQISSILKNNGFDVNYLDFSYEKYDKYPVFPGGKWTADQCKRYSGNRIQGIE